ncbi:MAG: DUF3592 domain-containing protein [Akkermansia sp.]|nr:DUF3592 domain-containing protein [Akkermansia sp.]
MQPADTQAETPDLSPILQAGEEVLWSEPRQRAMDHAIPPLLLGAVVLLVIYALIVWESLSPGGLGEGCIWSMLFIPGLALLCVLLAALVALRNRRTVYVLTQRRALICRRRIRKWRIDYEAPIARDLIHTHCRAADGTADYIFEVHRFRRVQLPVGFIGVSSVQALESLLTACGVRIPKQKNPADQTDNPPSLSHLFFAFAAFVAMLSFCIHESKSDPELMLTLYGEPAIATVVAHRHIVAREARGSGGPLLRYHPVLQFSPASGGTTIAIDLLSDEDPAGKPGDQVEILYSPQNPTLAMRATSHRFERPAILLAILLGLLWYFLNGLRRHYLQQ